MIEGYLLTGPYTHTWKQSILGQRTAMISSFGYWIPFGRLAIVACVMETRIPQVNFKCLKLPLLLLG